VTRQSAGPLNRYEQSLDTEEHHETIRGNGRATGLNLHVVQPDEIERQEMESSRYQQVAQLRQRDRATHAPVQ